MHLFFITNLTRPVPFLNGLGHGHFAQLVRTVLQPPAFIPVIGMRGLAFADENNVVLAGGLSIDGPATATAGQDQEENQEFIHV